MVDWRSLLSDDVERVQTCFKMLRLFSGNQKTNRIGFAGNIPIRQIPSESLKFLVAGDARSRLALLENKARVQCAFKPAPVNISGDETTVIPFKALLGLGYWNV